MTAYVALLRAVNVGGTGKLPMAELKRIGEASGFARVSTYIASGNLLFTSTASEREVKAAIEAALRHYAGKPVGVMVRTAAELAAAIAANPFADGPGNNVAAIFLDGSPPDDLLAGVRHQDDERIAAGKREIYVAYGSLGMGRTKLVIPAAKAGTARNMNTVAKLAELTAALV